MNDAVKDLAKFDLTTSFWNIRYIGVVNSNYHVCFLNISDSQKGTDLYPSRVEAHEVSHLYIVYRSFLTMLND